MYINIEKIKKYFQKNEIKMSIILLGSILLVIIISFLSINYDKNSNEQEEINGKNLKISNDNVKKEEKGLFLSGFKKRVFIKDESKYCFKKNNSILDKKIHEDLILKKYTLNKDFLKCILKRKDFGKFKINDGDIFITKNNQIVLYNGTHFTGNDIIKIDGHY